MDLFDQQLNRLIEAIGGVKDVDLARALDVKQQSITAARRKRNIPPVWFVKISEENQISLDWLVHGIGEKNLTKRMPTERPPVPVGPDHKPLPIKESRLEAFRMWIYEISAEDPAYWGWLNIELVKRFPEFQEWLKKQEAGVPEDSETSIRNAS